MSDRVWTRLKMDDRGRISLDPLGPEVRGRTYRGRMDENGVIYLEPARLVTARETEEKS